MMYPVITKGVIFRRCYYLTLYNIEWQNDWWIIKWKKYFERSCAGITEVLSQHSPGETENVPIAGVPPEILIQAWNITIILSSSVSMCFCIIYVLHMRVKIHLWLMDLLGFLFWWILKVVIVRLTFHWIMSARRIKTASYWKLNWKNK
jgi:hypothetical protein